MFVLEYKRYMVFTAGSHISVVCPKHFSEFRKQHMIIETEAATCLGQYVVRVREGWQGFPVYISKYWRVLGHDPS